MPGCRERDEAERLRVHVLSSKPGVWCLIYLIVIKVRYVFAMACLYNE